MLFVIYADFECFTQPSSEKSKDTEKTLNILDKLLAGRSEDWGVSVLKENDIYI